MAIKVEKLSSDITLELNEEEIPLADFTSACEAFSGLVREISRHVKPEASSKAWSVKVYEGSAGIGVSAHPGIFVENEVNLVREELLSGLEQLTAGLRPEWFSDRAIEFARNLAGTFKKKPIDPDIRIWSRSNRVVPVGRAIVRTAKEILDPSYEDEGSVEGRLEKLDSHDKMQFVVYDLIDDRAIKCEVDEHLLKQAWEHWKKRIEVLGKVRYRRDGLPVSIKATELIPFPAPEDIPSLAEMRQLLAN